MIQAVTGTHIPIQYATSPCLWGRVSVFSSNKMPHNTDLPGGRALAASRRSAMASMLWTGSALGERGGRHCYVDCALHRYQGVLQPAHLHQQHDEHRDENDD